MSQVSLQLSYAFTVFSSVLAVQFTWTEFKSSFNIYATKGPGGCNRNAPNGVPMGNYVLTSLGDAWTASNTVTNYLPTEGSISNRNIRGLLFLLFGITWTSDNTTNPDDGSDTKYEYILSTGGKTLQDQFICP